jgi:hypothetical protein
MECYHDSSTLVSAHSILSGVESTNLSTGSAFHPGGPFRNDTWGKLQNKRGHLLGTGSVTVANGFEVSLNASDMIFGRSNDHEPRSPAPRVTSLCSLTHESSYWTDVPLLDRAISESSYTEPTLVSVISVSRVERLRIERGGRIWDKSRSGSKYRSLSYSTVPYSPSNLVSNTLKPFR